MKKTLWVLGVVVGLVITGYNFYQWAFPTYYYESSDRGMADVEIPWKGRGLKIVQADFEAYKRWKGLDDLILYRTSKQMWWVPSLLFDNITNERWKLPYMEASMNPKSDYFMEMKSDHTIPHQVNPPKP